MSSRLRNGVIGEEFLECLAWCSEAEGLAGSVVEFVGDGVDAGLMVGDLDARGQVFADQPVGVLVRGPLPQGPRVREVDGQLGRESELRVAGHFGALIPLHRAAYVRGQVADPSMRASATPSESFCGLHEARLRPGLSSALIY